MSRESEERRARRRRGILLGGLGLALTFVPAIALLLLPLSLAPVALGAMILGLILLVLGFFTVPRRM